jgi:hypothetical protein
MTDTMTDTTNQLKDANGNPLSEAGYYHCDHCGKETTCSGRGGYLAWCGDCTDKDWDLYKTALGNEPAAQGCHQLWKLGENINKLKAIPKKATIAKCDHCDREIIAPPISPCTAWCADCTKEDYALIKDIGWPRRGEQEYWTDSSSVEKLKAIPKRETSEVLWGDWTDYPPCAHCGKPRGKHQGARCLVNGEAIGPLYARGQVKQVEQKKEEQQAVPSYNVWIRPEGRWTVGAMSALGLFQDLGKPCKLTFEQARKQADHLIDEDLFEEYEVEVRELLPGNSSGKIIPKGTSPGDKEEKAPEKLPDPSIPQEVPLKEGQTDCIICGCSCKDQGPKYQSACESCSELIYPEGINKGGNGFPLPSWDKEIANAKLQYAEKQNAGKQTITINNGIEPNTLKEDLKKTIEQSSEKVEKMLNSIIEQLEQKKVKEAYEERKAKAREAAQKELMDLVAQAQLKELEVAKEALVEAAKNIAEGFIGVDGVKRWEEEAKKSRSRNGSKGKRRRENCLLCL